MKFIDIFHTQNKCTYKNTLKLYFQVLVVFSCFFSKIQGSLTVTMQFGPAVRCHSINYYRKYIKQWYPNPNAQESYSLILRRFSKEA